MVALDSLNAPAMVGLVVLAVIMVVALIWAARLLAHGARFPYESAKGLFTPAELQCLHALDRIMPSGYRVFGKVRVVDVAAVKQGLSQKQWWAAFGRVKAKHFDYVICRMEDSAIACVVELQDKSHERKDRARTDRFKREVCAVIGTPFVEIAIQRHYDLKRLQQRIVVEALGVLPARSDARRGEPPAGASGPAGGWPPQRATSGGSRAGGGRSGRARGAGRARVGQNSPWRGERDARRGGVAGDPEMASTRV